MNIHAPKDETVLLPATVVISDGYQRALHSITFCTLAQIPYLGCSTYATHITFSASLKWAMATQHYSVPYMTPPWGLLPQPALAASLVTCTIPMVLSSMRCILRSAQYTCIRHVCLSLPLVRPVATYSTFSPDNLVCFHDSGKYSRA